MTIHTHIEDGVGVATIDHQPSNLIDGPFFIRLLEVFSEMEDDESVRVLVFRSADPDFFLMHGDVDLLRGIQPPYEVAAEPNIAAATFTRLHTGRLVTIGLLDGVARGGGCEFLCGVDLRLGSERALVGQPEIALGTIAGAGGTVRWPQLVGRGRALDILLSGRDATADELYAMGWLDRLVPAPDLDSVGLDLARRIAAMPPEGVAAVKRVVGSEDGDALVVESDEVGRLLSTGGHRARMDAFVAAGGQDRASELHRFQEIVDAVLDGSR